MLWQSALLLSRPGLVHGFTGRHGGVSEGPLASLNLSLRAGEHPARRDENWRRVRGALGLPAAPVALGRQVHGDTLLRVQAPPEGALHDLGEGDAVLLDQPGVLAAVMVADCVPVLLAGPRTLAAVHAGWRGTALGIVGRAARAVAEADGCAPGQIWAAVGPCIGACCYEVGEDVASAVGALTPQPEVVRRGSARPRVDLGASNRQQLLDLGLTQVELLGICTRCSPDFFSHRGDGPEAGRQAGLVGWR